MRPLPPELRQAQQKGAGTPYLTVTFRRREGGVERLRFYRWYAGAEPAGPHALAAPADGSLVRARIQGSQLLYQRVAAPRPGSDFSQWTALDSAHRAVALAAWGQRLLLAYIQNDAIVVRESADYGATLGPPAVALPAPTGALHLAAALGPGDKAALFFATSSRVLVVKRSGGAWGQPTAWTHSLASVSGLACHHQGDYHLVVTGSDNGGRAGVWALAYGDGHRWPVGYWSPLREVQVADAGSQVSFDAPSLALAEVYRLCFRESYAGTTAYSRLYLSHIPLEGEFSEGRWREPLPMDLQPAAALAVGPGGAWLAAPHEVWNAPLPGPALEVGPRLLALEAEERPLGGRMRLLLEDSDGQAWESGLVVPGAEVEVAIGYLTSVGPQASPLPYYWVEAVERRWERGRATLAVEARPFWGLLEAFRARRQFSWPAGENNVFQLLATVLGRAGVPFSSLSYSDAAVNLYPAFALHPGQSGAQAVQALLSLVPDVLVGVGPAAYLKEPQADEAPAYRYGDHHPVLGAWRRLASPPANRVQVFGGGVFGEAFLWDSVWQVGDRLRQVRAPALSTPAQVGHRLQAELRRLQEAPLAHLEVPPNCGQELFDVVEVTAVPLLPPGRYRVVGLETVFHAQRGLYRQRLALAPP